jgi:hypothetical protein
MNGQLAWAANCSIDPLLSSAGNSPAMARPWPGHGSTIAGLSRPWGVERLGFKKTRAPLFCLDT